MDRTAACIFLLSEMSTCG